jgi:hypothetical protein
MQITVRSVINEVPLQEDYVVINRNCILINGRSVFKIKSTLPNV